MHNSEHGYDLLEGELLSGPRELSLSFRHRKMQTDDMALERRAFVGEAFGGEHPGEDIRDPKFAPIGGRLFLYVLKSTRFIAEPYRTALRTSADGVKWSPLVDIDPEDGSSGGQKRATAAYGMCPHTGTSTENPSCLNRPTASRDRVSVSTRATGTTRPRSSSFRTDGSSRPPPGGLGQAGWATSAPPPSSPPPPAYTAWKSVQSRVTRLDGPALFSYNGKVYAVGRHNPDPAGFFTNYGSILARKRTSFYRVLENRLVHLSDLPSAGDTSYAGVVIRGDDAYISYYTSGHARDYPWIIGMLARSDILVAKVHLPLLERLAAEKIAGTR